VPPGELVEPGAEALTELAGRHVEAVAAGQHVQDGVADGGWQRVVDVRSEEQKPAVVGLLLDLGAGEHAASGSPAPRVLDRVRMSGTTPSRSKAYQSPVRHSPV
jgi:hypothetical protein